MRLGAALECSLQRAAVGHVDHLAAHVRTRGAQSLDSRFQAGGVEVEQADTGTVFGHHFGVGQTDAAGCTGDDAGQAGYIELLQGQGGHRGPVGQRLRETGPC